MAQMTNGALIGIIAVVVVAMLGVFWLANGGQFSVTGIGTAQKESAANAVGCNIQPSITATASSFYNKGTFLGASYQKWIGGVYQGFVTLPESEASGDVVVLLANASGYYNAKSDKTMACGDTPAKQAVSMYQAAALTSTFYNTDDQPATAQVLNNGDNKIVQLKLSAASERCFGNPQSDAKMTVVFQYNVSQISSVKVIDGVSVSVPKTYSGVGQEAYTLNIGSLCNGADDKIKIDVKADTTNNPTQNVTVYVMDPDLFVNSKTSVLTSGVENADLSPSSADVGQGNLQTALLIS